MIASAAPSISCSGCLRRDHVAQPFGAMRFARGTRLAHERRRGAGDDRRVDPGDRGDESRVARGTIDVRVAVRGRDRNDAKLRQLRRERERDGIIDSGIGVDEN